MISMQVVEAATGAEGDDAAKGGDAATADGAAADGAAEEAPVEENPPRKKNNTSLILKWFITFIIFSSIFFCFWRLFKDYWSRNHREKIDIASALGLALAYISNEEDRNPNHIIKHGVGREDDNVNQWVADIWETYDFNDDGNLDKREIRKFIDQTFLKIGISFDFHDFDFDDFFMNLDITQSGTVSKAEFRNFLRKVGNQEPDIKLQKFLRIPQWVISEDKKHLTQVQLSTHNLESDEAGSGQLDKEGDDANAIAEDDIKLELGNLDSDRKPIKNYYETPRDNGDNEEFEIGIQGPDVRSSQDGANEGGVEVYDFKNKK